MHHKYKRETQSVSGLSRVFGRGRTYIPRLSLPEILNIDPRLLSAKLYCTQDPTDQRLAKWVGRVDSRVLVDTRSRLVPERYRPLSEFFSVCCPSEILFLYQYYCSVLQPKYPPTRPILSVEASESQIPFRILSYVVLKHLWPDSHFTFGQH